MCSEQGSRGGRSGTASGLWRLIGRIGHDALKSLKHATASDPALMQGLACNDDHIFKLVLIGDSYVGKSCLFSQYTSNIFLPGQQVTIGADYGVHRIQVGPRTLQLRSREAVRARWSSIVLISGPLRVASFPAVPVVHRSLAAQWHHGVDACTKDALLLS